MKLSYVCFISLQKKWGTTQEGEKEGTTNHKKKEGNPPKKIR